MIGDKLAAIQGKLKAPKDKYNDFGRYKYRSAEDIYEAVKPYLAEYGCFLTLSDEVKLIGSRYYIVATAALAEVDTGEKISVSAMAREEETKKGMDGSQITGTASSYARKYALGGLFLLDDTKDADTNEFHVQTVPEDRPAQKIDIEALVDSAADADIPVEKLLKRAGVDALEKLTVGMVRSLSNDIEATIKKRKEGTA